MAKPFPFRWTASPDISTRAAALKLELEQADIPRGKLLELAAAHKAHAEWLERLMKSREHDACLRAIAFPECCEAPIGFEGHGRGYFAVPSRAQLPFKGHRLAVDPECAPFFDIVDVKCGQRSCFVNAQSVAATLFPPLPSGKEEERAHALLAFPMPVAAAGIELVIEVRVREEGKACTFRASIWGKYFDDV